MRRAGVARLIRPFSYFFLRSWPAQASPRPPACDQEPSGQWTTVPPSAMSRFQLPTQGCPSHSSLLAHPARTNAASATPISFRHRTHVSCHRSGRPEQRLANRPRRAGGSVWQK
jgi:hypothetical protein